MDASAIRTAAADLVAALDNVEAAKQGVKTAEETAEEKRLDLVAVLQGMPPASATIAVPAAPPAEVPAA